MAYSMISVILLLIWACDGYPVEKIESTTMKLSQSAFGPAFDEIIVESSLTVRRKAPDSNSDGRQGRQNLKTTTIARPERILVKRQTGSFANAQSQAFNSFGPIGSFGASATGAQTQSLATNPFGSPFGSAGFSGTQQYQFNGRTVDIAFGNAFSGGNNANSGANAAAITVTGPDGMQHIIHTRTYVYFTVHSHHYSRLHGN